ncbi:MAG: TlpA disulfide reductase family protein [Actinomycetota bacterium]|nr:TlpA disulfide reductase family protein [Actinomycetota bacterium]
MGRNTRKEPGIKVPKTGASVAEPESGGKGFILAILAIVLVGAGLVAFLAANRDSKVGGQTAAVEVEGDDLPPFEQSGVSGSDDPALGLVAPTFTGTTFAGEPLTLGPDGTPKVVYFLAHWCSHCQAEVPKIQEMIDADQLPDGLEIYGVSTAVDASRGNFPPESWLDVENFTPPTLKDDTGSPALQAWGGQSFPYVVYLDGDNRVIARSSGEIDDQQILELWALTALNGGSTGETDEESDEDSETEAE